MTHTLFDFISRVNGLGYILILAFLAGFVLLPMLGILATHVIAVSITVLVATSSWFLSRSEESAFEDDADEEEGVAPGATAAGAATGRKAWPRPAALYAGVALIGGASLKPDDFLAILEAAAAPVTVG